MLGFCGRIRRGLRSRLFPRGPRPAEDGLGLAANRLGCLARETLRAPRLGLARTSVVAFLSCFRRAGMGWSIVSRGLTGGLLALRLAGLWLSSGLARRAILARAPAAASATAASAARSLALLRCPFIAGFGTSRFRVSCLLGASLACVFFFFRLVSLTRLSLGEMRTMALGASLGMALPPSSPRPRCAPPRH